MRVFGLTEQAAANAGWTVGEDSDGLQVEVATTAGRTHVVYVEPGADSDGDSVAWVWSKAADSDATDDPWGLLALNAELTYGRVALKGDAIVVAHALLDGLADLDEVAKALFATASAADDLERRLYGHDVDVL